MTLPSFIVQPFFRIINVLPRYTLVCFPSIRFVFVSLYHIFVPFRICIIWIFSLLFISASFFFCLSFPIHYICLSCFVVVSACHSCFMFSLLFVSFVLVFLSLVFCFLCLIIAPLPLSVFLPFRFTYFIFVHFLLLHHVSRFFYIVYHFIVSLPLCIGSPFFLMHLNFISHS